MTVLGRALLAVVLALMVISIAPTATTAADCAPNDALCRQLQDAKQSQADAGRRLQDIQGSLADAQNKAAQTLAYLNDLKARIAAQQAEIAQTVARLGDTERRIQLTEADISRREAQLEVRRGLLSQRVRALDKHGSVDYMELLVTSHSFSELVDRITIMQGIVQSDQRLVDTLRRERDQIRQLRQELQKAHDQQAALLAQQRDREAQVERTTADQQQALDYYHQLEAQLVSQRAELEAEKARIDSMVAGLQAKFDAQARSVGGGTGRFGWPERGPITQRFGCTDFLLEPYDPTCPTHHTHTGLDIGAVFGTPVGAADAGVVSLVNTGWGGGYGNYVMITHGNGYMTLYAHLSSISVSVNQTVQRGQMIGEEGSTGFSTGPHLHFEIRFNGAYQDPLAYLSG
ncbi:MAG TPA: peptidoglycan DD-metalloendopeptidase family protein [Candidatus Dormibacteraeota bacterium]|nr:peptidoglycan DD-metalloendopeptidase family protein [Candidatus Dormibacteraeota bacterium]